MQHHVRQTVLSIVASSIIMVGAVIIGGQLMATPTLATPPQTVASGCLDEPLTPAVGASVRGSVRLCISDGGVQPWIGLDKLASGRLYSTWLAYGDMPATAPPGHCLSALAKVAGTPTTPLRIDAAVADVTGQARQTALVRDLRVAGSTEVQLLAVDHGPEVPGGSPIGARQLLTWQGTWVDPSPATGGDQDQVHLIGCASFRLRGGVESLDPD